MEEELSRCVIGRGEDGDEEVDKRIRFSFTFHYKLKIPKDDDGSIYQGTITCDNMDMVSHRSFIPATQHHLDSLSSLKSLSSYHPFLLSFFFSELQFNSKTFLITSSPVSTLDQYFSTHFPFSHKTWSKPEWYQHISHAFGVLFNDVKEALLYIHSKNITCGNLNSNIFVTEDGRARILPSYDNSFTSSTDIQQLIQLMKKILNLPFQDQETEFKAQDFGLPHQLLHFLSIVPDFIGTVPAFFLMNHPYFWGIRGCVDFVLRMEMVMSPGQDFQPALSHILSQDKLFQDWSDRLFDSYVDNIDFTKGVDELYREIWFNTGGGKQDLDLQKDPVQIVLTKGNVAESLHKYYPQFYTAIFKGICTCVKEKRVPHVVGILEQISLRYYDNEDECEFL